MKKILYISYDGMTDPLGQSQVLPYLVILSALNYRFTILSFEKKSRFVKEGKLVKEIMQKAGIDWIHLMYTKNPPVLSKIYDRWKMKRSAARAYRQKKFDMIHCRSYVAAEMGLWLKKKYQAKFLFDMRGFWADEKIDNGQWNMNSPIFRNVYKHYKKREKEFLLQADGIISLTQAAKNELIKNSDYRHLDIDVIPCCADLDHFDFNHITKDLATGLRKQIGVGPEKRIITYLGSVGGWYMIKEMFVFFRRLLLKNPGWVMLILTRDSPGAIRKQAAEAGLPEDKMVVLYAGRSELPAYLNLSDCSLFFIRPTYSKIASSPTKHAELMGMGIPVICNDIGDTGRIIEETNTGLVVKEFTETEYDRVIEKINELTAISKESIRQAAFKYFDLEMGAGEYSKVYKRILKG